jgi:hypothetical protein
MKTTPTILALKPYLEAIGKCCQQLSHDELCDVIQSFAQEVTPRERADFLTRLESYLKPRKKAAKQLHVEEELIGRIQGLREDIAHRQAAIEDGSYYEEYGDYGHDYGYDYYDEEIEVLSEEQREDLQTLFAETDHLFLANELELAEQAYRLLLNLFGSVGPEEDDEQEFYYAMSEHDINIDWRETRARYCRCVYETCAPKERPSKMYYGMQADMNMFESRYAPSEVSYPMLQDVVDAKAGELADLDEFLTDWQKILKAHMNNRVCVLLLEAVQWTEGLEGVAREVRNRKVPVGYLYWLDQLVTDQVWPDVGAIAQEALENMPTGRLRAQAAEILSTAGTETGNNALILQGKQEHFYSTPSDQTLAALIEEAVSQQIRHDILEQGLNFLEQKEGVVALKIKTLLMLGRLTEASQLVDTDKALGWSYGATGLGVFFGGVLTALTHADDRCVTINAVLQRYSGEQSIYYYGVSMSSMPESEPSLVQYIRQGLQDVSLNDAEKERWFQLAKTMGGNRIDGIVSNKHRNAYARAAEVLGALMECCALNEDQAQTRSLLETYRNEKYRRYSAFRREVDRVLKNAPLLKAV